MSDALVSAGPRDPAERSERRREAWLARYQGYTGWARQALYTAYNTLTGLGVPSHIADALARTVLGLAAWARERDPTGMTGRTRRGVECLAWMLARRVLPAYGMTPPPGDPPNRYCRAMATRLLWIIHESGLVRLPTRDEEVAAWLREYTMECGDPWVAHTARLLHQALQGTPRWKTATGTPRTLAKALLEAARLLVRGEAGPGDGGKKSPKMRARIRHILMDAAVTIEV